MSHEHPSRRSRFWGVLKSVGSTLAVLGLLAGGFWGSHLLAPGQSHEPSDGPSDDEPRGQPATVVQLSDQKRKAAGVSVVAVAARAIQTAKTVAATIDYAGPKKLTVMAPVDSVVSNLLVAPGEEVKRGQRLVRLSSTHIAVARSEVKKWVSDIRLAQIEQEWNDKTHSNLGKLLLALKKKPGVADLQSQFRNVALGEHRDRLFSRYSEFLLANKIAARIKPLGERGIVPGRRADEELSRRDVSAIAYEAACEQAAFESRRMLARSSAVLKAAEQGLRVAEGKLRLLLGPVADNTLSLPDGAYEIQAPFNGRIEAVSTVAASRLQKGAPILVLADTSRLWVSALVHQHEWNALKVAPGRKIDVSVPAIPTNTFSAQVLFVGARVSAKTRALPVVADLDNSAGSLRPGMFAWVTLPTSASRRGLAVPPSAVQRHESRAFVFVRESDTQFRQVMVSTGVQTPDYVEITSGLSSGQLVVDGGSFYLKSELLLSREEE